MQLQKRLDTNRQGVPRWVSSDTIIQVDKTGITSDSQQFLKNDYLLPESKSGFLKMGLWYGEG